VEHAAFVVADVRLSEVSFSDSFVIAMLLFDSVFAGS
jgi:hypothetical protein